MITVKLQVKSAKRTDCNKSDSTSDNMDEISTNEQSDENKYKVIGWGVRHKQCMVLLGALTIAYSMRACMGMALVGMVQTDITLNTDNNSSKNNNSLSENVTADNKDGFLHTLMLIPPYPQFNWSKKTQDIIISSFFFGYMLLQIPAGQLAHRFGARRMMTATMVINAVASVFFPIATYYGGWIAASTIRICQGLSQACIMPSCHHFLGKWTPLEERGRLSGMIYGAQALGPVFGLPLTGFIAASPLGWPGIFHIHGVLAGVAATIIWIYCADSPSEHKSISSAERNYIEEALKQKTNKKRLKVPWSRLLSHRGLYGIMAGHIGRQWGVLTLYSEVPAYMDKVIGVNIKANGILTALPFLVMWFTSFFFGWFFDMLIVKKYVSVTWSRKIANTVGSFAPSIGLICLAHSPNNIFIVESIMIVICGLQIAGNCGFLVNHIDISPNFAGTMMSLCNFVSNAICLLAPIVAGVILTDVSSPYLWRQVFFVSSGIYFVTNVIYVVLGTSKLADWNDPDAEKDDKEDNENDAMITKEDIGKCS